MNLFKNQAYEPNHVIRFASDPNPNFIRPHTPTPQNALLGWGGVYQSGGYKIPAARAQNIHPHPF